jgi:hypothetical protein
MNPSSFEIKLVHTGRSLVQRSWLERVVVMVFEVAEMVVASTT